MAEVADQFVEGGFDGFDGPVVAAAVAVAVLSRETACVVVAVVEPASLDRMDETSITPKDEEIRGSVEKKMISWDNKLEAAVKRAFDEQEKSVLAMLWARDRPAAP